ncbi:prepilin-type N-terminal cleavage/methylation domain-containing protein [Phorcysia thermohydrogeniphila]|uniref:Type IV pilus assembly protein PilA n=1 Tax=Phorcysia thermohydrogeniphila TaxID=936138 RepID=A0A4V2PD56_9BACT|nr:prepilin-type N-terminal cleavage/methylation domain-containing protein [Phorcysia thermohydrogeniphila]TCK03846.1 type IV pilus assembly protein PilA [Phorcysia thermohydrogeniphila]
MKQATQMSRSGFTLVELLIVIAIIAILAAIAVPQFAKYKERAYVAAMNSDAHNIIAAEEAYYSQYDKYATGGDTSFNSSKGTLTISNGTTTVTTLNLSKNVVLLDYDDLTAATQIEAVTCPDGSPGYKFALGHNNIKASDGTYKRGVKFNSCTDKAPVEWTQ